MKARAIGLLWIILAGLVLVACGAGTPVPAPTTATPRPVPPSSNILTLHDWQKITGDITGAGPAAQAQVDTLWATLTGEGRVPLVLDDQVVFLYKGPARRVVWRGVFTHWQDGPGLEGRRLGATDLWVGQTVFPPASRAEYKIVLNDQDWILDPANPATVASGETTNSLLVLPGNTTTDISGPQAGAPSGTLSDDQPIASRNLGYMVNYRVYTPAGYEALDRLPVLYVLDGQDFMNPRGGAEPIILDNLLAAQRIRPVLVVFVDPREPGKPENNRRETEFLSHAEEYARFIATELVPTIDGAYRTAARPEARIIQGVSYGGLSATYIAASYPQVFHNLAALSPSLWVLSNYAGLVSPFKISGARKMDGPIRAILVCGEDTGIACPALPLHIFLSWGVPDWDVGDLAPDAAALADQGYPLRAVQVNEGHAWSAWRGVLDDMLITFLGQ
jgi:enterochelin esterase family protein